MKNEKIEIEIKMIAKFSWLTALKLRLAGANYIQKYIEEEMKVQRESRKTTN